jgi:hypothetical protein
VKIWFLWHKDWRQGTGTLVVHALGQNDIGRQGQIQRRDAADFLQTRFDRLRGFADGENRLGLIVHDYSLWF